MENVGILLLVGLAAWAAWVWDRAPKKNAGRKETVPTDAPGLRLKVAGGVGLSSDRDVDDEEDLPEAVGGKSCPVKGLLRIRYADGSGDVTDREVEVRECDTVSRDGYLGGLCRLRGEPRTFRIDRIRSAIDMETGEVVGDIPGWAAEKYEGSPAQAMELLLQDSTDALRALIYVAKADGRYTKKEKQVFLEFCRAQSGCESVTQMDIDKACSFLSPPTLPAFKQICGRLAKRPNQVKVAVLQACGRLLDTEKTMSDAEEAAMRYMHKRFQDASSES